MISEHDEPDECPSCRGHALVEDDDPGDYPNGLAGCRRRPMRVPCPVCGCYGSKLPAYVVGEGWEDE